MADDTHKMCEQTADEWDVTKVTFQLSGAGWGRQHGYLGSRSSVSTRTTFTAEDRPACAAVPSVMGFAK